MVLMCGLIDTWNRSFFYSMTLIELLFCGSFVKSRNSLIRSFYHSLFPLFDLPLLRHCSNPSFASRVWIGLHIMLIDALRFHNLHAVR